MTEKNEAELLDNAELRQRCQFRNLVIAFAIVEAIAIASVMYDKLTQ